MAASAEHRAVVRGNCNLAADDAVYTDDVLDDLIERFPLLDERGEPPFYFSTGEPPTKEENTYWIPTYDLNRASAEIWERKAAALADTAMDFSAEGGSFSRSQLYENAVRQAARFRSRRAVKTITTTPAPPRLGYRFGGVESNAD